MSEGTVSRVKPDYLQNEMRRRGSQDEKTKEMWMPSWIPSWMPSVNVSWSQLRENEWGFGNETSRNHLLFLLPSNFLFPTLIIMIVKEMIIMMTCDLLAKICCFWSSVEGKKSRCSNICGQSPEEPSEDLAFQEDEWTDYESWGKSEERGGHCHSFHWWWLEAACESGSSLISCRSSTLLRETHLNFLPVFSGHPMPTWIWVLSCLLLNDLAGKSSYVVSRNLQRHQPLLS